MKTTRDQSRMADSHHRRQGELRPIQTSVVIVLGGPKAPEIRPPSPPTPCVSPYGYDSSLCEPAGPFALAPAQQRQQQQQRGPAAERRLSRGLHVLKTEAATLASLARLYETDAAARDGFDGAVEAMVRQGAAGGKVVVIGVGKSGHIGRKLVATLQSLALPAVFMHPTEALHGDLGVVGPLDVLLFITYSGRTEELLLLLPHLDEALPTVVLTAHTRPEACELVRRRPGAVLLPAPIPEAEEATFGLSAPSTSTTAALALCDALAMTAAAELHRDVPAEFARNHPGGAIGAAARQPRAPETVRHVAVPWDEIPGAEGLSRDSLGVDLLQAGFDSKTGWVRVDEGVAAPGKIRQLSSAHLGRPLGDIWPDVMVARHDMIPLAAETPIRQAGEMVRAMQAQGDGRGRGEGEGEGEGDGEAVIAVTEGDSIVGVVEARRVLHHGRRHAP